MNRPQTGQVQVLAPKPAPTVTLANLSLSSQRYGLKGSGAPAWLNQHGLPVPATPNQSVRRDDDLLIARLGLGEYLLEGRPGSLDPLVAAPRAEGVYPVLRQDACFLLRGPRSPDLLAQVCSLDLSTLEAHPGALALSSMAGIAVILLPLPGPDGVEYRLWCDNGYEQYLWDTLCQIAEELGGGVADLTEPGTPIPDPPELPHETR